MFFWSLGLLRDSLGSYDVAFYLAGVPPIIGGFILCLIPWVHSRTIQKKTKAVDGEEKENNTDMACPLKPGTAESDKKGDVSVI